MLLGLTIVVLDQTVIWQVASKTAMVVTAVILVGQIKPFKQVGGDRKEQVNEVLMMFVVYHMICFTPFMPDAETAYNLGYTVISLIAFHLIFNILGISGTILRAKKIAFLRWNSRRGL